MKITKKQRGDMLRAHNKLRDVLSYVDDCRDINVSHLRDIEGLSASFIKFANSVEEKCGWS